MVLDGVYHEFQSTEPDGPDPTILRPSDQNARHLGNGLDVVSSWEEPFSLVPVEAGGGDSTAGLVLLFAAMEANPGREFLLRSGSYRVDETLELFAIRNTRLRGHGAVPGLTRSVKFLWDGPAGGTVMAMNRCRDAIFEDFSIEPGTSTIGVGLNVDQYGGASSQVSTALTFRNLALIGATDAACWLSELATDNNDLHTFDHVSFWGAEGPGFAAGDGVGDGLLISDANSKMHKALNCNFGYYENGVHVDRGSVILLTPNYTFCTVDVQLDNATDVILEIAPQSEHAWRHLVAGPAGNAWAVTIVSGRLDPTEAHADGKYIKFGKRGPLNLLGPDFAGGLHKATWSIEGDGTGPGTVINALGCVFPNDDPFVAALATKTQVQTLGCVYLDGSNVGQPFPNLVGRKSAAAGTAQVGVSIPVQATTPVDGDFATVWDGMMVGVGPTAKVYIRLGGAWVALN